MIFTGTEIKEVEIEKPELLTDPVTEWEGTIIFKMGYRGLLRSNPLINLFMDWLDEPLPIRTHPTRSQSKKIIKKLLKKFDN